MGASFGGRKSRVALVVFTLLGLLSSFLATSSARADTLSTAVGCGSLVPAAAGSSTTNVIVGYSVLGGSADLSPQAAVTCVGGQVLTTYPSTGAVDALVASASVSSLSSVSGLAVTSDVAISLQSVTESTGPHTPSDVFLQETGATAMASGGDTGQGVTVAVLDTGIDALPDFSGRLVGGVDFTGANAPFNDGFGHGTFVAGLVAGDGASSGGQYSGEAPGANLVAIKVAGPSGQTDLATVISGVDWAIANRQTYGIRVLNMSLGFQPFVSTVVNPLDQAVEAAWNSGIVVVTSAGNAGPYNGTILSPGDDPLAITVGALDDMATTDPTDDEMTDFSSVGPTNPDGWVKPDLVTSGRSVVSLAAPGSTVYTDYPSAMVGSANFVGSGTSFSAAITSGAVALLLEQQPNLVPNEVKARLINGTTAGPIGNQFVDGHGALNVVDAAASAPVEYNQSLVNVSATSMGATVSLSATGPADTWNPALWNGGSWNGGSWNGGSWNGGSWNGGSWNDALWNGGSWNGGSWNGAVWDGAMWNGGSWNGGSWNGGSWNGGSWNGGSWNGGSWNGGSWNSGSWSGGSWN